MAYDLPLPQSLQVGEKGMTQNFDNIRYATVSVPATSVSATAALVTVSVAGIDATRDKLILVASPAGNASATAVGAQVSGTNAVVIRFTNAGAGGVTPAGNFTFLVLRSSIGS